VLGYENSFIFESDTRIRLHNKVHLILKQLRCKIVDADGKLFTVPFQPLLTPQDDNGNNPYYVNRIQINHTSFISITILFAVVIHIFLVLNE